MHLRNYIPFFNCTQNKLPIHAHTTHIIEYATILKPAYIFNATAGRSYAAHKTTANKRNLHLLLKKRLLFQPFAF